MPRLAPKLVELDNEDKQELEKILARYNTSQQVAKRAKIILLASLGKNHRCESPEKYGRPISHWTSTELAEEMEQQGIVSSISVRHVGRLLSEATLKPHQSEYWLNPPPRKSLTKKSKISVICTNKHKS